MKSKSDKQVYKKLKAKSTQLGVILYLAYFVMVKQMTHY